MNYEALNDMIAKVKAAIAEADRVYYERPRSKAMSARYWRIRALAENEAHFAGAAIQCGDPPDPHKEYLARDLAMLAKTRTALAVDALSGKDRIRIRTWYLPKRHLRAGHEA
jgi:hypothetical protein